MPRFDEPNFTRPVPLDVIDDGEPLPRLVEDEGHDVLSNSDEQLVRVEHRRVRTLSNYWHAGWHHAVAETLLRADVAARLGRVADSLPPRFGLAVFDAWRPLPLQRELYEVATADPTIEPGLMAAPSEDPATPPPHLTGGAVDLTLTYDAAPLALGTGFDDVTARAHTAAIEAEPGAERSGRRMLYRAMRAEGFVVFRDEWWHFEFGTRRWAAITDGVARYGPAGPR